MLEIKNLTKYYDQTLAVDNLILSLNKGEIFGFIGPNGAGKSTTIRCIMNLINKTNGTILIDGEKYSSKVKNKIGYVPSEIHLYDDLTVWQMIEYDSSFYPKKVIKKAGELLKTFALDKNKKIEDLSLGNMKKLGIILALMHEPKLLILDEITSGLDPLMQNILWEELKKEKEKGTTIFFSTHVLSEITKVCDRVGIIKDGKLIALKDVKELETNNIEMIKVISKDSKKLKKIFNKITEEKENMIKGIYNKDINTLIKELSKYDIEKLIVEDLSIEEIFMHYYK